MFGRWVSLVAMVSLVAACGSGPAGDSVAPFTPGFTLIETTVGDEVAAGTWIAHKLTDCDGSPDALTEEDGVLWATCDDTVVSFDGREWSTVSAFTGPGLEGVHLLDVAGDGELIGIWAGHMEPYDGWRIGLGKFRDGAWVDITPWEPAERGLTFVEVADDGDIWLGSPDGYLAALDDDTLLLYGVPWAKYPGLDPSFVEEMEPDRLPPITGLAESPDGTIWIATNGGVFQFVDGEIVPRALHGYEGFDFYITVPSALMYYPSLQMIAVDSQGRPVVALEDHVAVATDTGWNVFECRQVRSAGFGPGDEVVAATAFGAYRLDGNVWTPLAAPSEPGADDTGVLFTASDGSIWFAGPMQYLPDWE